MKGSTVILMTVQQKEVVNLIHFFWKLLDPGELLRLLIYQTRSKYYFQVIIFFFKFNVLAMANLIES
jgi:hypothetical protein